MIKGDFKELDEALKQKLPQYLYKNGDGAMVPIAQMAMIRNRDRSTRKQFPVIKALGEEVAFNFVFEGNKLFYNAVTISFLNYLFYPNINY